MGRKRRPGAIPPGPSFYQEGRRTIASPLLWAYLTERAAVRASPGATRRLLQVGIDAAGIDGAAAAVEIDAAIAGRAAGGAGIGSDRTDPAEPVPTDPVPAAPPPTEPVPADPAPAEPAPELPGPPMIGATESRPMASARPAVCASAGPAGPIESNDIAMNLPDMIFSMLVVSRRKPAGRRHCSGMDWAG